MDQVTQPKLEKPGHPPTYSADQMPRWIQFYTAALAGHSVMTEIQAKTDYGDIAEFAALIADEAYLEYVNRIEVEE
jgi:hypothetical protein